MKASGSVSKKRKLFDELMAGVEAMRTHRAGQITLRTYEVEDPSK